MACHDDLIRKLVGDDPEGEQRLQITRRSLLGRTAGGLGALALASLLDPTLLTQPAAAAASPLPSQGRGKGAAPLSFQGRGGGEGSSGSPLSRSVAKTRASPGLR